MRYRSTLRYFDSSIASEMEAARRRSCRICARNASAMTTSCLRNRFRILLACASSGECSLSCTRPSFRRETLSDNVAQARLHLIAVGTFPCRRAASSQLGAPEAAASVGRSGGHPGNVPPRSRRCSTFEWARPVKPTSDSVRLGSLMLLKQVPCVKS